MADHTKIEWTDATWNPITGCSIVSPGCTNCYAMNLAGTRLKNHDSRKGLTKQVNGKHVWTGAVRFNAQWLDQPLRWTKPRMIFVCAHGDLFAEGVPDEWLDQIFAVMALAPQHTFQVLTKRPERMRDYLRHRAGKLARFMIDSYLIGAPDVAASGLARSAPWPVASIGDIEMPDDVTMRHWPLPNVWLGVSVEDQRRAEERIPILLETMAAIRWISAEPLLGPVDLTAVDVSNESFVDALNIHLWGAEIENWRGTEPDWETSFLDWYSLDEMPDPEWEILPRLDWVVVGGESGPNARPMHPDWARGLRDQCAAARVPFLFKQWGEWSEACSDVREADGSHIEVAPDSDEGEALYDPATDRLIALDGRLFTPDTLPPDTPARLIERLGKRAAGRLLDGVTHDAFPEVPHV